MKLYQVRKGQFVYFNNDLHRVYSVKPKYKRSIHLIRLKDLEQHITEAGKVERYKPKQLDCFTFNHKKYTLLKDRKAVEGDYILVTHPSPDYLDNYSLNEIEKVASVEGNGVITNRSNGIKHNEYSLMSPGREHGSDLIDYHDKTTVDTELEQNQPDDTSQHNDSIINIGDVYKKNNSDTSVETMVIAIDGEAIMMGGGIQLSKKELADTEKWEYMFSLYDK